MLYTDDDGEFIVYTYIAGETHFNCGSKKEWMTRLVNDLFNSYKKVEIDQPWGRINEYTYETWSDFNKSSFAYARNIIGDVLPSEDHIRVEMVMNKLNIYYAQEEKYYIHGDTGVHNFVYVDKQLKGVIDPSPLIAPIIYDFTYAFCSSPDSLDLDTLFSSFKYLNIPESFTSERLIDEVLFQFYTRIGICIKAHPHDLSSYLEAWSQWRNDLPYI